MSRINTFNQAVSTLSIVGTGLLGGSIGLGLRAAGFKGQIIGVGRRLATLKRAVHLGCIDQITTDLADAICRSDLVVLATPLGNFCHLFEQIAAYDHEKLLVTDVGSSKQQVCADARRLLPRPQRFCGSHPMAGSEQQGPEAACAQLFHGKPCIITPEPDTEVRVIETVQALWTSLGMHLLRMSAQEHDRQTAVISHLPHAVAVLLIHVAHEEGGHQIASSGFRDTTRLASSNPPMRTDIMFSNRTQILNALDAFGQHLTTLRRHLAETDAVGLAKILDRAKQIRDDWLTQP